MEFNTLFTGKNYIELERVDSTNNYAANLIKQTKVPDGTVILAHFQESGRGQMGNTWQSPPGQNIMTSIIFHLGRINTNSSFLLSKAVSLAVYDTISIYIKESVTIKWPNDIYVGSQKIAGILIENKWLGKECTSIIGIGLNVNQQFFGELNATSLSNYTGLSIDVKSVLNILLSKIEKRVLQIKRGDQNEIAKNYLDHLRFFRKEKQFKTNTGEQFTGKIIDVKNSGHLIIELSNNEERAFLFKEVFTQE